MEAGPESNMKMLDYNKAIAEQGTNFITNTIHKGVVNHYKQ